MSLARRLFAPARVWGRAAGRAELTTLQLATALMTFEPDLVASIAVIGVALALALVSALPALAPRFEAAVVRRNEDDRAAAAHA